jgi:hypothetical protein
MRGTPDLRDRWVNFMVQDVHMPCPEEVLRDLYGKDILQGKVMDLSDSGLETKAYAVVQVDGLKTFLIVPVERILGVL